MWVNFLEGVQSIWRTDGVSEFVSALLGGAFAIAAQFLALRHDREKEAKRIVDEAKARAWSIYFKISQAHEAITATNAEIASARRRADAAKVELWQVLQFPPHDWQVVSWDIGELVLLIDHKQFDLMQRYQESTWWLKNLVESAKLYREMRLEFLQGIPSKVEGDRGTIEVRQGEEEAIMPTIAHLRSLANSLETVLASQQPDVRTLLIDYAAAMKDLCGHRPTLEFVGDTSSGASLPTDGEDSRTAERGGLSQTEIIAIIEEATHQRGWISNAYAQVEYLLGDLLLRCRDYPEYTDQTASFTHSATKRVAKVRSMLNVDGPLAPYAIEIGQVLDAFENNHEIRNLLAHGFCEFHFTAARDAGLVFSKFQRGNVKEGQEADVLIQRTFRLVDMHYHREQFVAQSQRALEVFAKVHFDLGWGDLDPSTLEDGWFRDPDPNATPEPST